MKKRSLNVLMLLLIAVISLLAASPACAATGRPGGPMKAIKPPAMTEAQSQRFKARIYSAVLDMRKGRLSRENGEEIFVSGIM